jgi:hypothetical protein
MKLRIETGMLVVETAAKIRRAHLSEGKGIKTIARELGLSRGIVTERPRRRGGLVSVASRDEPERFRDEVASLIEILNRTAAVRLRLHVNSSPRSLQ